MARQRTDRKIDCGDDGRPRRLRARFVAWALFATVLAAGSAFADTPVSLPDVDPTTAQAEPAAPPVTIADPNASGDCQAAGVCIGTGVGERGDGRTVDERGTGIGGGVGAQPVRVLDGYTGGDAIDLLPAYRWRGNTPLSDSTGILETVSDTGSSRILNGVATLFFTLAKTIWSLVLFGAQMAMSQTVIDGMATRINEFFATIATGFFGGGVLAVVVGAALLIGVRMVLKGGRGGAAGGLLRLGVTVIVPLAILQVLAASAGGAGVPRTSPAGLAQQANAFVNATAGGLLSAVTNPSDSLVTESVWSAPDRTLGAGYGPNCESYVDGLYKAYDDQVRVTAGPGSAAGGAAAGGADAVVGGWVAENSNAMTKQFSQLWELAFLRAYLSANFGHPSAWSKAGCHFLDGANDVDAAHARDVALAYGGYAGIGGTDPSLRPFNQRTKPSEQIADSFIWVVCDWDGSAWVPRPGWAIDGVNAQTCATWWTNADVDAPVATVDDSGVVVDNAVDNATGAVSSCADRATSWWNVIPVVGAYNGARCLGDIGGAALSTTGDVVYTVIDHAADGEGRTVYEWGRSASLYDDIAVTEAVRAQGEAAVEGKQQMRSSLLVHFGASDSSGVRMTEGIVALITALIYAWVFLGLSLGATIAQFGFVLLVAILPVTLVLAAFPAADGTRNQAGAKLLRLTASFLVARVVLLFIMALFITAISLLHAAMQLVAPDSAGYGRGVTFSMFLTMIVPLIAVYVVRKLLSSMGLGNLTSLKSNLMLPTALARQSETQNAPGLRQTSRELARAGSAAALAKNPELAGNRLPTFLKSFGDGRTLTEAGMSAVSGGALAASSASRSGTKGANGSNGSNGSKRGALSPFAALVGAGVSRAVSAPDATDKDGQPLRDIPYTGARRARVADADTHAFSVAAERENQYNQDLVTGASPEVAARRAATRDAVAVLSHAREATGGTFPIGGDPLTGTETSALLSQVAGEVGLRPENFTVGDYGLPMLTKLSVDDVQQMSSSQWDLLQSRYSYVNYGLGNLGLELDGNHTEQVLRLNALQLDSGALLADGSNVELPEDQRISQSEYLALAAAKFDTAALPAATGAKFARFQKAPVTDARYRQELQSRAQLMGQAMATHVDPFPQP